MQSDPKGTEANYLNWDYGAKRWDHSSARMEYFPLIEWDDDGSSKPGEIIAFGGHRYQLVTENLKWNEAYDKAKAMGGTLAVITTREESDQLTAALNGKVPVGGAWIGGVMKDDSTWSWVTGESFDFKRWANGQPDRSGRNLIMTANGGWDDAPAATPRSSYIVEWNDGGTAKPAPVAAASAGAVNLLALVDVKRDVVKGKWLTRPDGLQAQTDRIDGKLQPDQVLGFNQSAPEEYDFEIEFTLGDGNLDVMQVLPSPNGTIHWRMRVPNPGDHTVCGFGPELDGKGFSESGRTEAVAKVAPFQKGQRHRSLVEVRKGSLRALLDGKEIVKWSGDFKRFTSEERFTLPDAKHPGIACFNTITTFHKAELRPPAAGGAAAPQPPSGSGAVGDSALPKTVMPAVAPAPTPPADPRLAQLETGFRARYEADAQKPFLSAVAALNQSYVANGISRARAAAQAKGSLSEITALDAEKAAIEKGSGVPVEDAADTPASLKALRGTYRTAFAKITTERDAKAAPLLDLYLKALDAYIAELTKADKIKQAQEVQALLEKIAQQKPAAPSIVTSAPAPPATKTVEFSWRKAAEFIMSDGQSSCRLAKDGQEFVVNAGQVIPDGAYDIIGIYFERFGSPLPQPTDAEFKVFNGLKTLRNMYVRSAPKLTDDAFAFLADNPDLTSLRLANTGVSERLLKHIVGLKNLKTLDISNVRDLTGKGMKEAAYLPVLEELVLQGTQFSNASVAVLSACQNLQQLNLRSTAVTDAGLEHLQSLSRLTSLFISGTKVTDKAIAEFKAAHPQCKVE